MSSFKSDNGLPQQNLVRRVDTETKTFLFRIGSGHAPNVVHTTIGTSTLRSISCGAAWVPLWSRRKTFLGRRTAMKHKPNPLGLGALTSLTDRDFSNFTQLRCLTLFSAKVLSEVPVPHSFLRKIVLSEVPVPHSFLR